MEESNIILDDVLAEFFDAQLITDVVGQLKSGKEAQVFVCRAHPATGHELLAAKVYRPREERAFRSEATYLEGRSSLQRGRARSGSVARAIERRSRVGRALLSRAWVQREYDVLRRLERAGVRVPSPVAASTGAVLMQYLGDEQEAAPRLVDSPLTLDRALAFRKELLDAIARLLALGLIHGDLSAYNVLVFDAQPWIIDLPQSVDAAVHPDGCGLLTRDVANLTRHFARYGLPDDGCALGRRLWDRYQRGAL